MRILTWAAASSLAFCGGAFAQVAMQGEFTASSACPALQSIKKGAKPGNVSVEQGKSYALLGKNKDDATHYWIEVPAANPPRRWVKAECGSVAGAASVAPKQGSGAAVETDAGTVKAKRKPKGPKGGVPFYAFALSWEPAFCETMKDKAECKVETPQSYEATHFSLHGLWPQPRRNVFCGVDAATAALDDTHQWEKLPEPELTPATKSALDKVMPGTQSVLERHEWIKHGTCYPGRSAETYFKDEIRLVNDVNASPVQAFMAANIGKTIQTADLRKKFDEAYGKGAGARVKVSCGKTGLISEITIGLKGDVTSGASLAELIAASDTMDAGCRAGMVDAVK
jgi:ribonuclease T2